MSRAGRRQSDVSCPNGRVIPMSSMSVKIVILTRRSSIG